MRNKHRVISEDKERDHGRERREYGERRQRSRFRDRKHHHRNQVKSTESRKRIRSKTPTKKTLRRKPSQYWDVPAPGFEHITPIEYKKMRATGQIPANIKLDNSQIVDHVAGTTMTYQARRLYIENIPLGITEYEMMEFFNKQMHLFGLAKADGNPVIACQINLAKNYAFLEFRSIGETTQSMNLNGIYLKDQKIKIRRPREYQPTLGITESNPVKLNMMKYDSGLFGLETVGTSHKLFVGGLPVYLNEEEVKELLTSFGQLKTFNLVKDEACVTKSYAFCEYADVLITDLAIVGLNGVNIGETKIVVHRTSIGAKNAGIGHVPVTFPVPGLFVNVETPTEVLCLLNMVTPDELKDEEEYGKILENIRRECNKYGGVRSLKIPRPIEGTYIPGCGKVFVEFNTLAGCQKIQQALYGRTFNNRVVLTSFMEPDKYHRSEF